MDASPAWSSSPSALGHAPQLRTLLLTDLCDSTALVQHLGDVAAAVLFRDHDAIVLTLQQQWCGHLIDRSDGLLLLFGRPIDGLGFALDYLRCLRELGAKHKVDLKARAGLHVGEVLAWRNSDEAVRVGAKLLEVEGAAKSMTARLMAAGRPNQILLSAVAQSLAHRAVRELGKRGLDLMWKSHGRWCFKGVPDAQEIFEVGERVVIYTPQFRILYKNLKTQEEKAIEFDAVTSERIQQNQGAFSQGIKIIRSKLK
jgi:putative peptide modification system cyclase